MSGLVRRGQASCDFRVVEGYIQLMSTFEISTLGDQARITDYPPPSIQKRYTYTGRSPHNKNTA